MQNKTIGSTLIISGTAIGAGMLALPLVISMVGLVYGLFFIALICWLASYGGILIANACRVYPQAESLHGLVDHVFGKLGKRVVMIATLFLYWSLCSAYISGISGKLSSSIFHQDNQYVGYSISAIVAVAMGLCLVLGTKLIDNFNRIAFFTMLGCLVYIIASLIPEINITNNSFQLTTSSSLALFSILPILFTSFGYHIVIPSVCTYLDHNHKKTKLAIISGGIIPALIYVVWIITIICLIPSDRMAELITTEGSVKLLTQEVNNTVNNNFFEIANSGFYILAMLTSFFGVSLGLADYLAELSKQKHDVKGKINTALLTLLAPLIMSIFVPNFVKALGFAAIALTVLAIFVPVIIDIQICKEQQKSIKLRNKLQLALATILGLVIVFTQLGIVGDIIPSIS